MSEEAKEKVKKEVTLESIQKGLFINRIIGLACFAVLAGIFIVVIIAYSKVNVLLTDTRPTVDRIQNLDMDGIENSVNEINSFVANTDFDHASKVIESVPEDIFDQLSEIEVYLEQIASFADMKEDLAEAVDNFNRLSVQMAEFQAKMEPLLKLFSR